MSDKVQFSAIKTRRIYVEIVEQIRRSIAEGRLRPGDRLPPERELATQFGVGRPAVREALSALEMMGIIAIQPGQGAYVRHLAVDDPVKSMETSLQESASPLDLLEARRLLESQIVELAAARATQYDVERLNRMVQEMLEALNSTGEFSMDRDREFHIAIGEATQNPVLAEVSRFLTGLMGQDLWRAMTEKNLRQPGRGERYVKEHSRIARAIQDRDGYVARNEMFRHLSGVIEDLYSDASNQDQ
ncbi:MAG TPA: FadR family transcriptional regulator [Firmicutes bacterium]|nr:FadR family transcriptional regulator [Bacillota bacterium]